MIPILVPDLEDVREFASQLHRKNIDWQGEAFGWEAEYHASRVQPPDHSHMAFTPANFWVGDATIWGFSMMWEEGDDQPPVEALSDWNLL